MRTTPQTLAAVGFLALLPLLLVVPAALCTTAQAAALVGADQASGYSGHVLEKVSKVWQVPQYPSEHTVRIRVNIDGDGKILGCWPEQSSNLAQMDKSACGAVHDVGKFDIPPYGLPINVFLTFWTGTPKGNNPYGPGAVSGAGQAPGQALGQAPDLAQQNADAATAAALAAARAAEAKATTATKGAAPSKAGVAKSAPAPSPSAQAAQTAQVAVPADPQNRGPLVGVSGENPSDEEARYARRVAREIREKMIIPAEIPKGNYTFKMYVRVGNKGTIDKAEITQPSSEALMDKYALRAIKKVKELTAPPTQKARDLHLTFVVQRP